MMFQIKVDKNNNVIAKLVSDEKRDGYFEIKKDLFNKINLLSKINFDEKNEILSFENYNNSKIEKKYDIINKRNVFQNNLNETNQQLIDCFEYFLSKISNITNITDLLKIADYPHDLPKLLKDRKEIKEKINELEQMNEEENDLG